MRTLSTIALFVLIAGCAPDLDSISTGSEKADFSDGPATPNLAAGKVATQSSTAFGGSASRAVDGNPDGTWSSESVTHTHHEVQAWWQVDLGAVTSIGEVVLYNRTDCCSERLADFDLLVSNDGLRWRTAISFAGAAPARLPLVINGAGRLVRVQLRGAGPLSLAEVEVFGLENLAAGKAASQSSTAFDAEASRAVDGNTDGEWDDGSVSATDREAGAWWQVDLGAVTSIGQVILYNRTDCCSERLADFDVLLSDDGVSWRTGASHDGAAPERLPLAIAGSGRFVRVQLRGTEHLSLAEVEVLPL